MRLAAVESAHNFFLQPVCLRRVFGLDHSLGELTQFFRAEGRALRCMARKLEDRVPFVSRQPVNLFNDFNRCNVIKLPGRVVGCKLGKKAGKKRAVRQHRQ